MRKIKSLEDCNGYKYLIGLTPEDARVLRTSLSYLPAKATNRPEMKTLIKAVRQVAVADGGFTEKDEIVDELFNSNPNCDVCED